jgi:conjugal transfer pilus assembly protein TraE
MELKNYTSNLDKSILTNKILIVLLALSLCVCALEAGIIYKIRNDSRVILVPPTIQSKFSVSGTQVSDAYLRQMALYLAYLKLNVTPKTITTSHAIFENYVDSSIYGQVQSDLTRESKSVINGDISAYFNPTSILVDSTKLSVELTGYLNKSVGKRKLPQETVKYLIQFSYKAGQLHLMGMEKIK